MTRKIAFQGRAGAYSHMACMSAFPELEPLPCPTFAEAFKAVEAGRADVAMIPIDNSIAGRVADIHLLLPQHRLSVIAEHFIPVHHCLLGVPGAKLSDLKTVYSHVHALPQCKNLISDMDLKAVVFEDTAASAQKVAEAGDKTQCAIASALCAELYGLKILKKNVEDEAGNTTRFLALSKNAKVPARQKNKIYMTSLIFKVHNIPAALYKALGGFATNGVNMTKLESYQKGASFAATRFYADIVGAPGDPAIDRALEELAFHCKELRVLGTYPLERKRG
jgi:prephenate dehydratase